MSGPDISNSAGRLYTEMDVDYLLRDLLGDIYNKEQEMFPHDIGGIEDIAASYHCFGSLRWALDTRALEMRVAQTDIDYINQWGVNINRMLGV